MNNNKDCRVGKLTSSLPASSPPWVAFGLLANKLLVIERLLLRKGGQRRQNRLITNSPEMIISHIQIQRETEIQTDCFKGKEIRGGKIQIQTKNKSQHEKIQTDCYSGKEVRGG